MDPFPFSSPPCLNKVDQNVYEIGSTAKSHLQTTFSLNLNANCFTNQWSLVSPSTLVHEKKKDFVFSILVSLSFFDPKPRTERRRKKRKKLLWWTAFASFASVGVFVSDSAVSWHTGRRIALVFLHFLTRTQSIFSWNLSKSVTQNLVPQTFGWIQKSWKFLQKHFVYKKNYNADTKKFIFLSLCLDLNGAGKRGRRVVIIFCQSKLAYSLSSWPWNEFGLFNYTSALNVQNAQQRQLSLTDTCMHACRQREFRQRD